MGQKIGRFELLQVLGQGAFGRVYRARDPQLAREVALKVPLRETLQSEAEVQRFLGEARAAATIRHPNICPVYEVGQDGPQFFIVMAFVEGQSLASVLEERAGLLPIREAVQLVRTLALAMGVAHGKGIVHRDLKPANIMFDRDSGEAVIMDFGLARRREPGDAGQTQEGMILGTPAYMPPEQASGKVEAIGPHSDIYTLGVILYELLCGQRPFTGTPFEILGKVQYVAPKAPSKLRKTLDPRLEAICLKAMAKEPARRFSSAKSLADALGQYLETASTEAVAPQPQAGTSDSTEVEATGAGSRMPAWLWLAGGGVVLCALVLTFVLMDSPRTPTAVVLIRLDENLKDPALSFFLDGKAIAAEVLEKETKLALGGHELVVRRGDEEVRRYHLTITGGKEPTVQYTTSDSRPKGAPPNTDGWAQLFNGKDLTGWKTHPNQPGDWRVENGVLVGRGPNKSHLYSQRGDYEDFHFRVEAKINSGGNSGQQFRKEFNGDFTRGYEAQIDSDSHKAKTGSLYIGTGRPEVGVWNSVVPVDTWFTQEVIVQGNRIIIKVNGVTTVDYVDQNHTWKRGHFALQVWDPPTVVQFRKIEWKELTAALMPKTEPAPTPMTEPAPQAGWGSLFNGKDFSGWVLDSGPQDAWQVVNGAIVTRGTGSKSRGWLLSKDSYTDFQLKCQFQLGSDADGGIGIRAVSGETINTSPMHLAIKLRTIPVPTFKVETGSLYYWVNTAEPPLRSAVVRSSGSWNDLFIEVRGQQLRIEVNNQEIQNLDLNKVATRPQVMPGVKRTSGRIGLQQHSGQVSFRDIQIKDLTKAAPPPKVDLAPAATWVPLFNGQDLTGWQDANQQATFWKVQNGTLYYTGTGGTNLVTTKNYKNFEMMVDWKIPTGGDSGVYLRGQPQIQIWDNKEGSGGLWNNQPGSPGKVPLVVADNPVGAWNTMWVKMVGARVTVKLNDKLVVDNALLLDGKVPKEGPLELQKHRSAAWFKNIYVKELE